MHEGLGYYIGESENAGLKLELLSPATNSNKQIISIPDS